MPSESEWQPIETCPENVDVILWQPEMDYRSEGMIIGRLERKGWEKHNPPWWVAPSEVGGPEFDCEVEFPTHWMPKPAPPKMDKS